MQGFITEYRIYNYLEEGRDEENNGPSGLRKKTGKHSILIESF